MVFIFFETVCYGTLLAYVTVNAGIQCADRIRLFAKLPESQQHLFQRYCITAAHCG